MEANLIRNFAVIAHIDHGKSTLADRLLELTGAVPTRRMREQFLDSLELEREKGITIKLKAVRMNYTFNGVTYQLNMIDTPGHVDFGYEVSRSLAACEGVVLVVDASQGVQAQTVANVHKAWESRLKIIPFVNKIDLPSARPRETADELMVTFGFRNEEILCGSAKVGLGIEDLLRSLVANVPPPRGDGQRPLRALIFDSFFDEYQGVVACVRLVDGRFSIKEVIEKKKLKLLASGVSFSPVEIGFFQPQMVKGKELVAGEVGYLATGLKDIRLVRVGDTVAYADQDQPALPGYQEPKPMVFLGFYPSETKDLEKLRSALSKLQLSDGSLSFEPESGGALGLGFRCGFLGLLHAEIVQERLERDYSLTIIATVPSVPYEVRLTDGQTFVVRRASKLPEASRIQAIAEPYVRADIFTPEVFSGSILKLLESYRARFLNREYLGRLVRLKVELPLAELVGDFYDRLKSLSEGYASLDYEFAGFEAADLCRLDILIAGDLVDAFSQIVPRSRAFEVGSKSLWRLKETIDRHQFVVVLQAAIGGKIIARQEIPALRKNVLAKMSGGHRERKDKLLEKQSQGKKRLKRLGRVDLSEEAFRAVLVRD